MKIFFMFYFLLLLLFILKPKALFMILGHLKHGVRAVFQNWNKSPKTAPFGGQPQVIFLLSF